MPRLSDHVCRRSASRRARAFSDLPGLHHDGRLPLPLGRARRVRRARHRRPRTRPTPPRVGTRRARVAEAALGGHAVARRSPGARPPVGAVAAPHGRRRLGEAWPRARPNARVPGGGRGARGPRPRPDGPRPRGPSPACAQSHPRLRARARAAPAPRVVAARARGRGPLAPQAIDADQGRRGRQGPRRARRPGLGPTRPQAVTGGTRAARAPGPGPRRWSLPPPGPHPRAQPLVGQPWPPAGRGAREAGPVARAVAPTPCGHAPGGEAAVGRAPGTRSAPTARGLRWAAPWQLGRTRHPQRGAQVCVPGLCDAVRHRGAHRGVPREAAVAWERAWEALTMEPLPGGIPGASRVQWLGRAHGDLPPSHQVRHHPGARGWSQDFSIARNHPYTTKMDEA